MERQPFSHLRISPTAILDEVAEREKCPGCLKSRKYFCYSCCRPVACLAGRLPVVTLPYHIDVIKHPQELSGKSTAVHAAILAPQHVSIHTYPHIPTYHPGQRVVLVCPGVGSISLKQYIAGAAAATDPSCARRRGDSVGGQNGSARGQDCGTGGLDCNVRGQDGSAGGQDGSAGGQDCSVRGQDGSVGVRDLGPDVVVYIDSTWNQVHSMLGDPRLAGLQRVELREEETRFWRHQLDKPSTYLATIEAIYYTAREHWEHTTAAAVAAAATATNDASVDTQPVSTTAHPVPAQAERTNELEVSSTCEQEQSASQEGCSLGATPACTPSTAGLASVAMTTVVKYDGRYDDLLFFFSYYYDRIVRGAQGGGRTLKAYTAPRRKMPRLVQR